QMLRARMLRPAERAERSARALGQTLLARRERALCQEALVAAGERPAVERDAQPGTVGDCDPTAARAERALGGDVVAVPVEQRLAGLADRLECRRDVQIGRARDAG